LSIAQMLPERARIKYQEAIMLQAASVVMFCPRSSCGVLIVLDGLLSDEAMQATRHGWFADLATPDHDDDPNASHGPLGCPKCRLPLCFSCRSEWHEGMSCKQYQFAVAKNADAFTKFCRKMNWMRCFECGHVVEKKAGCNHIVCLCGSQFCYLCGSKWGECRCAVIGHGHALRHNRVLQEVALHACPHCRQQYPSVAELRVHLTFCQVRTANRGGSYTCNNCQMRFSNVQEYRDHRRQCFLNATYTVNVPEVDEFTGRLIR